MIISEDVYLEHFGVKGMRWGVRNDKRGGTPAQRRAGTKKFARNLVLGGAIGVAGGIAVGKLIQRNQNLKLAQIQRSSENIRRMTDAFSQTTKGANFVRSNRPVFSAIPLGPIGSTSVPRLNGAIPLPKIRR